MPYIILPDFKTLIQSDNLNQVIGNVSGSDYGVLEQVRDAAIVEVKSYLIQKYDCSREFIDTVLWDRTTVYTALQRIYLDATAYNATAASYALNDLVLYQKNIYICKVVISAPEAFTIAKWDLLGAQYAKFYAALPFPEFVYTNIYSVGDQVWWKGKTYTALQSTPIIGHDLQLQFGTYQNQPPVNPAPDVSTQFWGTGTSYTVAAGTRPTDTTKWVAGDGRNTQLVNYCIDIALYTAHSRIAPKNIPDLRVKRYDDAIKWLKGAAQGTYITAALPLIQPNQGNRIRYGGNVKNNNQY